MEEIAAARDQAVAFLLKSQRASGAWRSGNGLEVETTGTVVEALVSAGLGGGAGWFSAMSWLANAAPASTEGLARQVRGLMSAGRPATGPLNRLLLLRNATDRPTFGAYAGFETSFPDTPLALSALRTAQGNYGDTAALANAIFCEILPGQRPDGSWSYTKPPAGAPVSLTGGAILPTAYSLIELKAVQAATNWVSGSCGSSFVLDTVLLAGADWLLAQRHADGGFGENGQSHPLETALAYLALQAVRPSDSALPAALDYLVKGSGKPSTNGGWVGDPLTTALALQTLPFSAQTDTDRDGIPDATERLIGTNPTTPDGRSLIAGNGQGQTGVDRAIRLGTANLFQSFRQDLTGTYAGPFSLVAGALPDGLSLDGWHQRRHRRHPCAGRDVQFHLCKRRRHHRGPNRGGRCRRYEPGRRPSAGPAALGPRGHGDGPRLARPTRRAETLAGPSTYPLTLP